MQAVHNKGMPVDNDFVSNRMNILIVDDCQDLEQLEQLLLNQKRHFFKAITLEEALKILNTHEIGLIFLDIHAAEKRNFELIKQLKENQNLKDLSIIFITATSEDENGIIKMLDEIVVDYLFKPLEISIIEKKIGVFEKLYLQKVDLKKYASKVEGINKQLDEFVYIVSHDLKAPLRGLASLTTFMEDELGAEAKQEVLDILNMMKSRTNRMQNLIDGILHYSRMANSKTEKEFVNVKELLNNILDLLCPPPNVRFEFPDNLPIVNAEKIKLHEVFQNLIRNEIKYNNKEKAEVKISFEEHTTFYEFSVADNGIGIKPEHQNKIFGIFQTLQPKDKIESTGIGLTIVKKIIEEQEGIVSVNSAYDKGSTFKFTWKK